MIGGVLFVEYSRYRSVPQDLAFRFPVHLHKVTCYLVPRLPGGIRHDLAAASESGARYGLVMARRTWRASWQQPSAVAAVMVGMATGL